MYAALRPGSRFGPIYRAGVRYRSGGIVAFQATGQRDEPEVGFVAGKKVGNAVARNRSKRRLREAARRIELEPGTAYVFVATREVLEAPFESLVEWMQRAVHEGTALMDVRQ